jgi:hypothetical protein
MSKWCLFGALVALLLVFACPDADARRRRRKKRRKPAKVTAKSKAKKHFKKGQRLFRKKKYAEAIVHFKAAYALRKHPAIQFNIAMSYAYRNNTLAAARHIRIYLRVAKNKAKSLPNALLMILYQTGVLIINTPDPTAEIFVDGLPVGKGKAEIDVMIGKHSVEIRLGKRIAARRTVHVKPREERLWDLKEIPREAPRPRQIVHRRVARPPPVARRGVVIPKPAPQVLKGRKKIHLGWFVTTAALAVAAVGAGVGIDQGVTAPAFREYESGGNTDRDLYSKVITYRNITISLYAVAGTLGISAIIIALYTQWKKRERTHSAITLAPAVGPGNIGFSLRWNH